MKLQVAQIKSAMEQIFQYLAQNGIEEIDFKEDYYWNIPDHLLYNVTDDPKETTIGQLTDDYAEVLSDLQNREISSHTISHMVPLLRYISKSVI